MAAPYITTYPVKRPPGYLSAAAFEGEDSDLVFRFKYPDSGGVLQILQFRCTQVGSDPQEMCLPSSKHSEYFFQMPRDLFVSHSRMMSIISKTIPGSTEWADALINTGAEDTKFFQTPVGTVRINSAARVPGDDRLLDLEFQRGTTSDKRVIQVDIVEMTAENYQYTPSTQLLIVAGSVLKQFGTTHRHDPPNDILTAQERSDIIDYVNNLEVWV